MRWGEREEEECSQSNCPASVLDTGQIKAPIVRIGSTVRGRN